MLAGYGCGAQPIVCNSHDELLGILLSFSVSSSDDCSGSTALCIASGRLGKEDPFSFGQNGD